MVLATGRSARFGERMRRILGIVTAAAPAVKRREGLPGWLALSRGLAAATICKVDRSRELLEQALAVLVDVPPGFERRQSGGGLSCGVSSRLALASGACPIPRYRSGVPRRVNHP